jgi:hypothetical protein
VEGTSLDVGEHSGVGADLVVVTVGLEVLGVAQLLEGRSRQKKRRAGRLSVVSERRPAWLGVSSN